MASREAAADIRHLSDMARGGDRVVREAIADGRETVLMDGGRAIAVLVSAERYGELNDAASRLELIEALDVGEASAAAGKTHPHAEVMAWLRS